MVKLYLCFVLWNLVIVFPIFASSTHFIQSLNLNQEKVSELDKFAGVKSLQSTCENPKTWSVEFFSTVNRYFRISRYIEHLNANVKVKLMDCDLDIQEVKNVQKLVSRGYLPSAHLTDIELRIDQKRFKIKKERTEIKNEKSSLNLVKKISLSMCENERSGISKLLLFDAIQNYLNFWKGEVENLETEISLKKRELKQYIAVEEFSRKMRAKEFMTKIALQRDINATLISKIYIKQKQFSLDVAVHAVAYYESRIKILEMN